MALTLSEQLQLTANTLKPDVVNDPLIDLTHASGVNAARDFNTGYKIFPTSEVIDDPDNPGNDITVSINTLASGYLNKMLGATAKMIAADSKGLYSLQSVMSSLIAKVTIVTVPVIEGATEAQWEGFINDHIIEALELFAAVRIEEKAEYDSL